MTRPNILYLHSHDTGRYVSPYGHAFQTPRLQQFAEQGVLFRQAFCVNPTCSPSRAALLTGCYPHQNGMLGLAHRGFSLNDYGQHLLHTLRPAGYRSVLSGVQHIARKEIGGAQAIGYDRVLDGQSGEQVSRAAAAWLRAEGGEGPFFMSVGFNETHREFPPPDPAVGGDTRYLAPPAPLPDTPEVREDMAGYATMVHRLDTHLGRVLDGLEEAGLADSTLVIITTDHGLAFPHMKCDVRDAGIGVMLMLRGPGGFSGGKCIDAMVSHLDLYPTVCELAGVDKPGWLEGKSLISLVNGEVDELHEAVFATVNFHAAYEPQRAVRTRRHKYIRRHDEHPTPVLSNYDDSPSKRLLMDRGWGDRPVPREALYDLVFDPHETNNLAHDPAMAGVLTDLRGQLDDWMRRTDDPGRHGAIAPPRGARLNRQDQLHPKDPSTVVG